MLNPPSSTMTIMIMIWFTCQDSSQRLQMWQWRNVKCLDKELTSYFTSSIPFRSIWTFRKIIGSSCHNNMHFYLWLWSIVQNTTRCVMRHKCPRTRQIPEVAIIVKTHGQDFKIYGSNIKVLSQVTCIWNTKALSLTIQKIWPKSKFLKSGSNFKVKSQGQKLWYH
jgi:hypothetical protein